MALKYIGDIAIYRKSDGIELFSLPCLESDIIVNNTTIQPFDISIVPESALVSNFFQTLYDAGCIGASISDTPLSSQAVTSLSSNNVISLYARRDLITSKTVATWRFIDSSYTDGGTSPGSYYLFFVKDPNGLFAVKTYPTWDYLGSGAWVPSTSPYINEYTLKPLIPAEADSLQLNPVLPYIDKGETIQFTLTGKFEGESIDISDIASWSIGQNTIDEFKELNGFSIDDTGKLSAVNPTTSSIVVGAKYGGKGQYTTVFVKDFQGTYYPGGITGSDGTNQTGGGGSYGRLPDGSIEQSDTIDIPAGTVASPATATGFFTRYLADTNTISTFGRWLWTTDLGLQVAKAVISLIYGDPSQSVISLMSYPFDISALPGVLQSTGNIIWGNFNSGISSDVLNSQASQVDWGTIQLSEYWGNFLDYSPHTKISLYLPWGTGFVDLDPGECLPGTLNVKTNIDFSKGSCVHNVIGNGNLIGSFAGQCAQQIPVLSSDFASKVAGLVTAAAAGISAGAVGGAGVLAEAAMGFPNATISGENDKVLASFSDAKRAGGRIATTSLAINRHPVQVTRNGGFTDGSAALGCQYPYVIISRPKQSMPEQYGSHFGYPSNIYRQLGTLRGYTEVGEIHLEGIPATDAELSELDRILKGGVIF